MKLINLALALILLLCGCGNKTKVKTVDKFYFRDCEVTIPVEVSHE